MINLYITYQTKSEPFYFTDYGDYHNRSGQGRAATLILVRYMLSLSYTPLLTWGGLYGQKPPFKKYQVQLVK